ncbi:MULTISPECIES: lyase family protein [unclassified Ruegeria]|uniref:lyase family protein n=1 Tax=unclassified Ruegeria TaxID=2625375 RepID=UPI0014897111|nr:MULTISPECIES: lyase family protein [unclassified Ruegeria]
MTGALNALTAPIFGHGPTRAHFGDGAIAEAMLRVEVALAQAQASLGFVPNAAAAEISALKLPGSVTEDLTIGVAQAGVPVPALLSALRNQLSDEAADFLHFGATSQDIVDTAFCLCAQAALDDLADLLTDLVDLLHDLSQTHDKTLMLARTRGQLATPITFGLRAAQWAQPLVSAEADLSELRAGALRIQLGGASGSRSAFRGSEDDVARAMAAQLNLSDGPPWHTDRSGVQKLSAWLMQVVSAIGKIGRDVSIATRGEISELRLAQGGASSTMPHKSNPVLAEMLQSLVPVATGYQAGLAASTVHLEERDGANWPVEWLLMPLLFETAGAALDHGIALLQGLEVDATSMRDRVGSEPAVHAEAAVFALAETMGRGKASRIVKDALASGQPLRQALAVHGAVDWDRVLSDAPYITAASKVADEIFAKRQVLRRETR